MYRSPVFGNYFGRLAQLGERRVRNAEVEGSNPLLSTKGSQTDGKRMSGSFLTCLSDRGIFRIMEEGQNQHGGVPVSTGMWRQDKRAAGPDRLKTGIL